MFHRGGIYFMGGTLLVTHYGFMDKELIRLHRAMIQIHRRISTLKLG